MKLCTSLLQRTAMLKRGKAELSRLVSLHN
jgi:hypothetical protein